MAGDVIMSQTLPTVIGMGVVSQTTQTMFDKKGRRSKRKKKQTFKIYRGKRGGTYVIRKGRKVYL